MFSLWRCPGHLLDGDDRRAPVRLAAIDAVRLRLRRGGVEGSVVEAGTPMQVTYDCVRTPDDFVFIDGYDFRAADVRILLRGLKTSRGSSADGRGCALRRNHDNLPARAIQRQWPPQAWKASPSACPTAAVRTPTRRPSSLAVARP
jgi:hypothetical protein